MRSKSDRTILVLCLAAVAIALGTQASKEDAPEFSLLGTVLNGLVIFVTWYLVAIFVRWLYRKATTRRQG